MENIIPEDNLENKLNYQILFPFPFYEVPKVTVSPHQKRWEDDNGDFTKILDYPIDENSQVIELGGYIGEWTEKLVNKFNPNKTIQLHVLESSTSESIKVSNNKVHAKAYTIEHFVEKYNLNKIDLIQVNIECEEYPLLLHWITTDFLKNVRFIQIQFHTFCDDYEEKYSIISEGLKNLGFEIRYRYDFVWESWENKNFTK